MKRLALTALIVLFASGAFAAAGSLTNATVNPGATIHKRAQAFDQGIHTDDIAERTSGSGVTIDGVTLKDGAIASCTVTATDTISEASSGSGVTVDGVLLKDGAATATGAVTGGSAVVGGGYGSTGATVAATGNISTNGTLVVDGTSTLTGAVTTASDVRVDPLANGNNAGAKNEFIGLPRIKLVGLAGGTNGAAAGKTVSLMDDTPDGEWSAHDAETTVTADETYYRVGTKSLGVLFGASAVAGNGAHDAVTLDFSADESMGMWVMCDSTLTAGDLVVDLTDDGGAQTIDFPAIATANAWQWAEFALPAADGDKDVITDISIELSAAGAAVVSGGAVQCYFDGAWKWDSTEEDALGVAIQRDGVLGVINTTTGAALAEGTDYFVHEETGNDFVVWVTDQSGATLMSLVAY